ncbi:MarR family winged helix-turn-helix transcriptional regulator [Photobacterium satsumensis]|uniref:MarR family winged helix-turn-helix transcriptional regulator n=1 Tax=Photobacterium satsumensis TaxID=2910239 RepID=UPI003D148843
MTHDVLSKKNHLKELHFLYEYCRGVTDKHLRKHYINFGSYIVLNCIHDYPGCTQYHIAKSTGYSNQRTYQLTKKLEEQGFIVKSQIDERKRTLTATAMGIKVVEETEAALFQHFLGLGITKEQLSITADIVTTLNSYTK